MKNCRKFVFCLFLFLTASSILGQENQQTIGVNLSGGFSLGIVKPEAQNSELYGKLTNSVPTYGVGLVSRYQISKYLGFGLAIEFEKLGDASDFYTYDPYYGFTERRYRSKLYNLTVPLRLSMHPTKFIRIEIGVVNSIRLKSESEINMGPEHGWDKMTGGKFANYNIANEVGCYFVWTKGKVQYDFGIRNRNYWIKEADGTSLLLDAFPARMFSVTTLNLSLNLLR